jgi:hypothetical protein
MAAARKTTAGSARPRTTTKAPRRRTAAKAAEPTSSDFWAWVRSGLIVVAVVMASVALYMSYQEYSGLYQATIVSPPGAPVVMRAPAPTSIDPVCGYAEGRMQRKPAPNAIRVRNPNTGRCSWYVAD